MKILDGSTTAASSKARTYAIIAVTVVVLVIVFTIAGLNFYNSQKSTDLVQLYKYEVNGLERLYRIEHNKEREGFVNRYIPVTISTTNQSSLPVIDQVIVDDIRYVIALETPQQANVYVMQDGVFEQVTNSRTLKRNLGIDVASETISFEAVGGDNIADGTAPSAWELTFFNTDSGREISTGRMVEKSRILPTGREAIIISENALLLFNIASGTETELMQIYSPNTVAFSDSSTLIAIYNDVSKAIHTYSYTPGLGLSFINALETHDETPAVVAFEGDSIIGVYRTLIDENLRNNGQQVLVKRNLTTREKQTIQKLSNGASLTGLLYE